MQAPLLTWGPPVLQQWQRLLLLEEAACERDIASYSVFNVRLAAAVFENAGGSAAAGDDAAARLRRYAIAPWPSPPDEDAQVTLALSHSMPHSFTPSLTYTVTRAPTPNSRARFTYSHTHTPTLTAWTASLNGVAAAAREQGALLRWLLGMHALRLHAY